MKKKAKRQLMRKIATYLLTDYQFLQDYVIISTSFNSQIQPTNQDLLEQFHAKIVNSQQVVKFIKFPFNEKYLNRFSSLYHLYEKGVILADNIFILDEADTLYFYIIQAELDHSIHHKILCSEATNNQVSLSQNEQQTQDHEYLSGYLTLQEWIMKCEPDFERKKKILEKLKILLSEIHSTGECYNGLTTNKIIIDQEENVFLAPFALQPCFFADQTVDRAYYCPEVLKTLSKSRDQEEKYEYSARELNLNDIWAFGCIAAELFFYSMPIFYQPTVQAQLRQIQEFQKALENETRFRQIWMHKDIGNLIYNCLNLDQEKRKISNQTPIKLKMKELEKKTITEQKQKQEEKKLMENSYELTIKILNLSVFNHFQVASGESRINIYLDRQYSFFLDNQEAELIKINGLQYFCWEVNKSIRISLTYQKCEQLLRKPILIEIEKMGMDGQPQKIRANLYSLILLCENSQNWDKPLIGTYPGLKTKEKQAKIKLKCTLKSDNKRQSLTNRTQKGKFQRNEEKKTIPKFEHRQKQQQILLEQEEGGKKINKQVNIRRFSGLNSKLQEIAEKWQKKKEITEQKVEIMGVERDEVSSIGDKIKEILTKREIQI